MPRSHHGLKPVTCRVPVPVLARDAKPCALRSWWRTYARGIGVPINQQRDPVPRVAPVRPHHVEDKPARRQTINIFGCHVHHPSRALAQSWVLFHLLGGAATYVVLGADLSVMWETFHGDNRKRTATNAVAPIIASTVVPSPRSGLGLRSSCIISSNAP